MWSSTRSRSYLSGYAVEYTPLGRAVVGAWEMSKSPIMRGFNCTLNNLCEDVCKTFGGLNLPFCIIDMAQTLALSAEDRKKLNRSCDLRYQFDHEMDALKGYKIWFVLKLPGSIPPRNPLEAMRIRTAQGWTEIIDEYVEWAVNSQ